jgi:hypothetical protein
MWVVRSRGRWEPVDTGGAVVRTGCPWSTRAGGSCPAARGLCEWAAAVRPVGSGHFNRVGWYCRHGLGPIWCTTFFQLFKLCSNFEMQNKDHPDVHK